jgi:hypothetical protein
MRIIELIFTIVKIVILGKFQSNIFNFYDLEKINIEFFYFNLWLIFFALSY